MSATTVSRAAMEPNRIEPRDRQVLRTQNIRLDSIRVGKRMRPLGDIDALVGSIHALGS